MPNTTMNDVINPQVMGDMISAKTEAMLKITPYAKVDTTLQGVPGDTKTVPSWKYIGDAEDVTEGAEVGLTSMKASSTTFTIKKAMKAVGITQEAINSGYGNPVDQAETQLAKAIAGKVDNDVFAAALKTSQVSGDGSSVIAYSGVVDIVDVFDEEEITDKALFINPKQLTKLRKDTEFISADKYNNNVMVSGEIGMICQTRIIPSKKVPKITAKVGASSDQGAVKITADNAMLLNQPTIFGVNPNGNLMGGGEAGQEVVAGSSTLMAMIRNAVQNENAGIIYYLDKLISMLTQYFPEILGNLEREMVLDDGTLVAKITPKVDKKLGDINRMKERGQ